MVINVANISACILDMDGVVTNTARIHADAWKQMFDEFLAHLARDEGRQLEPFDIEKDYRDYVDGKPRYDGVESFLASRDITLPQGSPEDQPGMKTVCGLGNRKNDLFLKILNREGAEPYKSTLRFIAKGRDAGIRFALISASRNAGRVIEVAKLKSLFEVIVDGTIAEELDIAGKPAPDIFLEAARRLQTDPKRAMIIEDAVAGVQAGKKGNFALTIGIDRNNRTAALTKAGADMVVRDLAELSLCDTTAPGDQLPSALDEQDAIFNRLQEGTPAIFLDYDGTLTPIVDNPAAAKLDKHGRRILRKVSQHLFAAVISGRGLEDIQKMVGIDELIYAGSHGFEISDGSGYFEGRPEKKRYLEALQDAEKQLRSIAGEMPGVKIERKPYAVAAHYRNVSAEFIPPLEQKINDIETSSAELKKTSGKKIFELRPAVDWHKGQALRKMIEHFHTDCSRVTPLYIGDDTTDEDAFCEIAESGVAILVSEEPRSTAARYRLRNPSEVLTFLENLADMAGTELFGDKWTLTYEGFEPEDENLREVLCALGNGYLASRGAAPESRAGRSHYPGTYIAGCYNRLQSRVDGRVIENESMVNVPNWLPLTFRLEDGPWFDISAGDLTDYRQHLDIATGILTRIFCFIDGQKREIRVAERRLINMNSPHLAALETEITPVNWSGTITVRSAVDGRISNTLVARYRQLNNDHLIAGNQGTADKGKIIWLQVETRQSHIRISTACRTRFSVSRKTVAPELRIINEAGYIGQEAAIAVHEGETLRIEKTASYYHSRDNAISESSEAAQHEVAQAADFETMLKEHQRAWQHLWQRCGINLEAANSRVSQILNLHIFHLLQTVSVHSIDQDVGIPPRGLHGEAYRGLIMWDELFVFPFLNLRIPDLTRALLHYRYRRLPQAKRAARDAGFSGVIFPWQSGSNGREEAQTLHLNPESGHWVPDNTHLQRHINIAVAYNVWLYYQVTGDLDFMSFYGAEMIIEIARFWADIACYNELLDRYEIKGVMGPDEFHTGYPDTEEPGLNNNTYTNVMAVWLFCRALDVLDILPPNRLQPLWENLAMEQKELDRWNDISRKMRLVYHDGDILSQFEGYDELEEFNWEKYRNKYGNIHRLDRILEAEQDTPNRYKISKQADVLMLFYLLSADELGQLFKRMGYPFPYETIPRTIEYYLKRTVHGSTLSRVVHAWVLARSRREQSWNLFCDALNSDVSDIQGGTTHEGVHLGAMAGTVDLMQRCYTGMETRDDAIWFNPALPTEVRKLSFNIHYRHHWLNVSIHKEKMTVASQDMFGAPIKVGLWETLQELKPGRTIELDLRR
ncbi:MAG: trehalose-phosphatase [Desulfobulbaceae bacterium]|nr:trehalose-phosphatase [Desulfobulbaceae bacterium]